MAANVKPCSSKKLRITQISENVWTWLQNEHPNEDFLPLYAATLFDTEELIEWFQKLAKESNLQITNIKKDITCCC